VNIGALTKSTENINNVFFVMDFLHVKVVERLYIVGIQQFEMK
jgi:hypothetical protein